MELKENIDFANANPVCIIATEDGDQPRVRGVLMMSADESGFYFALLSPKQVCHQLKANPKVEVCYYNNSADPGQAKQMRVTGVAELCQDPDLIDKVAHDRAFLEQLAGQPIRPIIEIWRVSHGEAHFWTMMDVLKEPQIERIKF